MTKVLFTQVFFATPEDRVAYLEASLEMHAMQVVTVYRGLAGDHNDGEFALWSELDLVEAIVELDAWLAELARAREAVSA